MSEFLKLREILENIPEFKLDTIERCVNAISELHKPYVEEAKEIILRKIKYYRLNEENVGILGSFYNDYTECMLKRAKSADKRGKKLVKETQLNLLAYNLEGYIFGPYNESNPYLRVISDDRVSHFQKFFR